MSKVRTRSLSTLPLTRKMPYIHTTPIAIQFRTYSLARQKDAGERKNNKKKQQKYIALKLKPVIPEDRASMW